MCGRTTLTVTAEDLQRTFGFPAPAGYRPRYNLAPSEDLVAVSDPGPGRGLYLLRWGLVPWWAETPAVGNKLINARAETIATRPVYREAFAERRCLVVVDGFYEWQRTPVGKRPYRVRLDSGGVFTLAGVWEHWGREEPPIDSCAIVTTGANELIRPLHDRMPVIIAPEDRELWLDPSASPAELRRLLRPYEGNDLDVYEVSTLVNDPRHDSAECLDPVESAVPPAQGVLRLWP